MISGPSEEIAELLKVAEKDSLWPGIGGSTPPVLDRGGIEAILPHRPPFLFLDEVTCMDVERGLIAGRYDLEGARFFLAGHYPGNPMFPAIFQLEAIAQTGGLLYNLKNELQGKDAVLTHILAARFILPITPGADVFIVAQLLESGFLGEIVGQTLQNGKICSVAALQVFSLAR